MLCLLDSWCFNYRLYTILENCLLCPLLMCMSVCLIAFFFSLSVFCRTEKIHRYRQIMLYVHSFHGCNVLCFFDFFLC